MKIKRIKPLNELTPWVWAIEPVHGCNLRCGHCSHALDAPNDISFMSKKTWINCFNILKEISPTCRIDLCISGEPTLHPKLLEFLSIARKINPPGQIQITTNGTMISNGNLTYKELFEAGVNILYVDMYAPKELHIKLAKESGYEWYEYYDNKEKKKSPWTYWGPDIKMIVLQEQPDNWPKSRYHAGLLGTWYNHLNWGKARKYGLYPVTKPLTRRCNQPFLYVPVHVSGSYLLCCQDNWGETAGVFGSVNEVGVNGFLKYWFGKELQTIRRRLRLKNRADTSYCSRCCITFSRCDFKHWTDEQVGKYYDGEKFVKMPPYESKIPSIRSIQGTLGITVDK